MITLAMHLGCPVRARHRMRLLMVEVAARRASEVKLWCQAAVHDPLHAHRFLHSRPPSMPGKPLKFVPLQLRGSLLRSCSYAPMGE